MGAAIILSGVVLEGVGFESNAAQQPLALTEIRALFGGLPCLFYLVAAGVLTRLSLYEEEARRRRSSPLVQNSGLSFTTPKRSL